VRESLLFVDPDAGAAFFSAEWIRCRGSKLEDGTSRESEETFRLSPDEEAELLLSIEEADRGETVSLEEVLEKLPGPRP